MVEIIQISSLKDPEDPHGRSYKDVNLARNHLYKVGQLVELENGVRVFVARQTRDCDGTPLYCLTPKEGDYNQEREHFANHNWLNGYNEDSITNT